MITRNKPQYRPEGIREYLIHLPTGNIVTSQPYMRVDTFSYRNEKLKPKRLKWMWTPQKVNQFAKIPGGKLSANSHIWFPIQNLVWDRENRVLYSPKLKYFDGIGDLSIHITGKSGKVIKFTKNTYQSNRDSGNPYKGQLTWESPETDVKFVLAWSHKENFSVFEKPFIFNKESV